MTTNLPARQDDAPPVVGHEQPPSTLHAGRPAAQQNLGVALLPLAVIALLVLAFIAAAWTFLAALPTA